MDIETMVRAVQKELGLYVDGKAGPNTWGAIHKKIVPARTGGGGGNTRPPTPGGTTGVDARSESVIATLHPQVRAYARSLVLKAKAAGITIKVISGLRTYAEQEALYAKGRTKPGPKVTNARGGYSNHNFGIAFDVGVFDGSRYIPESPRYKAVGALGLELGLEWGGNWKTMRDEPHFQLRPHWASDETEKDLLAGLRTRKDAGRDLYA